MSRKRWRRKRCHKERYDGNVVIYNEHHPLPVSRGGKNKEKKKVRKDLHDAWHLLVRNCLSKEAAIRLSPWIPSNERFFAFNKGTPNYIIFSEILAWKDQDFDKETAEELPMIIQFNPCYNSDRPPNLVLFKNPNL